MTSDILYQSFLGQSVLTWLLALLIATVVTTVFIAVKLYITGWKESLPKKAILSINSVFFFIVVLALLLRGSNVDSTVDTILIVTITLWGAGHLARLWHLVLGTYGKRISSDISSGIAIGFVSTISSILIWIFAVMILLSGLGFNITTLITGLGIGGIAIALSVQNILGDLFSFFAIHFDNPCREGDMVSVSGVTGVIKRIGLRTTRIKAITGEEVVISNKEMTTAHIHNFKKANQKRISTTITLTTTTPGKQKDTLHTLLENITADIPDITFVSCHVVSISPEKTSYEVVLRTNIANFPMYLIHQETFLLALYSGIKQHKYDILEPINLQLITPSK